MIRIPKKQSENQQITASRIKHQLPNSAFPPRGKQPYQHLTKHQEQRKETITKQPKRHNPQITPRSSGWYPYYINLYHIFPCHGHGGGIPALLACAGGAGPAAWRAASALANLAEWQELVPELREAQGPGPRGGGKSWEK